MAALFVALKNNLKQHLLPSEFVRFLAVLCAAAEH